MKPGFFFLAGLVEKRLQKRFMHLTHGRNRLWSKIGAGDTTGTARDTHEVYITFSLDAVYHLDRRRRHRLQGLVSSC